MHKIVHFLVLSFCFSIVSIAAREIGDNCYLQELKTFKKSPEHEFMFNEDASPDLVSIQKSLEIYKDLTPLQRFARFMFLAVDPVIVTASTMPKLHAYVDNICKSAGIATPTIFITPDKHGFFNAVASKLFASAGGIIIGQKMIYEASQLELEAVIAHEIGHIKHNHVNKILALKFSCGFAAFILSKMAIKSYCALTNKGEYPQEWVSFCLAFIAFGYGSNVIINKRFEKEADAFAFENGRAQGMADFFQLCLDRERKTDRDFDIIYGKLKDNQTKLDPSDYTDLMTQYYLAKGGHLINKFLMYIYHHTPLGGHPPHEERIQAAQDYLAQHSDWNVEIN